MPCGTARVLLSRLHGAQLASLAAAAAPPPLAPCLQINGTFYKQIEGILATKAKAGLPASITSYPGQAHGFSLRSGAGNATTTAAADKAFAEGAAFLKKHLAAA